jgi:ACS family tartrate transporter-like MFS transporter
MTSQPADPAAMAGDADQAREAAIMRRVAWRLIPFLLLAYLVSVIDRVNIGFASIQMNHDLGLSRAAFGLAGGAFFLSYFLLEIPSNLAMQRVGASRWLARIMISWGLVAGATAFVVGPTSFLAMRLLLGAAEAGFFPGVILFLTCWFPSAYRARMIGLFVLSVPASGIVGSPVSGLLLGMEGVLGLHGWQWMFIVEALPAILLGLFGLWWLTDTPAEAGWLAAADRIWLAKRLEADRRAFAARQVPALPFWRMARNGRVLLLTLVCASTVTTSAVLGIWQPIIIKSFGVGNLDTGLLNAIPYIAACIAMVLWGRRSDRKRERVWHNAIPMAAAVVAMVVMLFIGDLAVNMVLLTIVMVGTYACKGPFWALATEALPASISAAAIAQINALGSLPGFGASYLIGAIKDATGSYPLAIMPIAALCLGGVIGVLFLGQRPGPAQPIRQAGEIA